MTSGEFRDVTKTYLPLAKVAAIVAVTVAIVMYISALTGRLELVAETSRRNTIAIERLMDALDTDADRVDERLRDVEREVAILASKLGDE